MFTFTFTQANNGRCAEKKTSDKYCSLHFPSTFLCLSMCVSPLLSNISSLSHPSGHTIDHRFSFSSPGGYLPFSKSGAAFCDPAGSKALTNGCLVHPLTRYRTNWHCKSLLGKKTETWCSWQRHTGVYAIPRRLRPQGIYCRGDGIKAQCWYMLALYCGLTERLCWNVGAQWNAEEHFYEYRKNVISTQHYL